MEYRQVKVHTEGMQKYIFGAFALLLVLFGLLFFRDGWSSNNPNPSSTNQPMPIETGVDANLSPEALALEVSAQVIGLTESEAIELIESKDGLISYRITRRDDENFVVTMDYRTDRINLEIEKDFVVSANVG
jgi:hypothetical protein